VLGACHAEPVIVGGYVIVGDTHSQKLFLVWLYKRLRHS
jgi:hypothetical protein